MADPSQIRSLNLQGLADEIRQPLLPVLRQLNQFLTDTSAAIAGNISLSNLAAQVQDLSITTVDDWVYPGIRGGPAWVSTWAPFSDSPIGFRKDERGQVWHKGRGQGGTIGSVAYQLPLLYRPSTSRIFIVRSAGGTVGSWFVETNGNVTPDDGTNTDMAAEFNFDAADRTPIWPAPFPLTYPSTLPGPMAGIWVVGATRVDLKNKGIADTKTAVAVGAVDAWESTKNGKRFINVRGIPGLLAGVPYRVRLLSVSE